MSNPTASGAHRPAGRVLWLPLVVLAKIFRSIYALSLIAVVLFLSWSAFRYLIVSLIFEAPPPPQIVEIPKRLDQSMLERQVLSYKGLTATENPRTPLAHYHRLEVWFQPDRFNDCTRSGCHAALPHSKKKEDRAFLNMHATSMHCGVCHFIGDDKPLKLGWYDLQTGKLGEPPPLLRAYSWLTQHIFTADKPGGSADQREIARLLRQAFNASGGEPALEQLELQVRTARPGSEQWFDSLRAARDMLPRFFRGEYGAKLAVLNSGGNAPILAHPNTESQVREFLRSGATLAPERLQELLKSLHPLRSDHRRSCTDCHRREGSLIDFEKLGYPPQRVEAIVRPLLMEAIQRMVEGKPMYLPGFLAPERAPASEPASQPASQP